MAKKMMDIGLDDSEDLAIDHGDFIYTESTAQHQQQLILNNKGDFKENPTIGVGAFEYFNDEGFQGLLRGISIEFSRDGMDTAAVNLKPDGTINTVAVYH
jgi:hypothetical protein